LSAVPDELKEAIRQYTGGQGGFAAGTRMMGEHYRRGGAFEVSLMKTLLLVLVLMQVLSPDTWVKSTKN
jgi:hypothetical protein